MISVLTSKIKNFIKTVWGSSYILDLLIYTIIIIVTVISLSISTVRASSKNGIYIITNGKIHKISIPAEIKIGKESSIKIYEREGAISMEITNIDRY